MTFDLEAVSEYDKNIEELLNFHGFVPDKYFPKTNYLGTLTIDTVEELASFIAIAGDIIIYSNMTVCIYNDYIE